jgi:hypothetical protein
MTLCHQDRKLSEYYLTIHQNTESQDKLLLKDNFAWKETNPITFTKIA